MADEERKPKGMLTINVSLRLPASGDSIYRMLNHACLETRVTVLTQDCTQDEALQIVQKIRAANANNTFHATWVGANEI